MPADSALLAVVAGVLQGVFEWLPISSEGNVAVLLSLAGAEPAAAVRFSLFLHAGTATSAAAYYRGELLALLGRLPAWRPGSAFDEGTADLSFFAVATVVSGVVGIGAYAGLAAVATELAGGAFVALVGVLLVLTGLLQRHADALSLGARRRPDPRDALLVGVMQGLAVLPGVSRSGTTAGALLVRGHDGPAAFRLSFVLSIPAAFGAAGLAVLDGGLPAVSSSAAAAALAASALVGFFTIDALVRLVRRVPFWGVCVGLGTLATLGGGLLLL